MLSFSLLVCVCDILLQDQSYQIEAPGPMLTSDLTSQGQYLGVNTFI